MKKPLNYLGLKDTILDISLTPNRADCMALYAFAYEVGAVLNREVTYQNLNKVLSLKSEIKLKQSRN